ncbi:hypothetical protein BT69DRAFT_1281220 [Atractiella rhizophila]|nr:hypothetical protein BT69DRAFT_1282343 [Atractiella rhizophila]KAH8923731.1 hypothetical protein BT69DRAFT_1281220 [Atractiella rhizophila]
MSNSRDIVIEMRQGDRMEEKEAMLSSEEREKHPPNSPPNKKKEEETSSRLMVAFSVSFYLVAALVMVFANKWVLNSMSLPLSILFVQLVIAVLLLHVSSFFGYLQMPRFNMQMSRSLAPLISINSLGLIFNTYCLQYVDASFYPIARGLVLPFTVLLSRVVLGTKISAGPLAGVVIVCFGFLLGISSTNINASALGVILGLVSSLTTSLHAIVIKSAPGTTTELVYYVNLWSAAVMLPCVLLSGELPIVVALSGEAFKTFWTGALVTGVFGFLISIAGFLSIKVTSPTTHMISSAVRGVLQTWLGNWFFGEIITSGRAGGIAVIVGGSALYTWYKDREQRMKQQQQSNV